MKQKKTFLRKYINIIIHIAQVEAREHAGFAVQSATQDCWPSAVCAVTPSARREPRLCVRRPCPAAMPAVV